jgi:hypothetical protein
LSAPEREVTSPSDFKVVGALNCIGGVMVSMLASCAVNCGFEPQSGQTKDYWIGICCFSAKHTAIRSMSKDWLARNQNNVSEWSDMSTHRLLSQWTSTMKIQQSDGLVQSGHYHHLFDVTCSRHDLAEKLLIWH